ncbi:uncharacterized protein LOC135291302 isoform X1 [Passer domesticus]|uniref:uncharacterized protein LOC135291302 isoform X1 n=1 Tax=Passer domesticus TaxID=48849 RepID=UPI0030FEB4CE
MLTSFLSTSPAPSEAAGRDAVGSRGRGRMWDARVPAEALPPGVARGRQRRRTSAAPLGPPDRPAQHRPVPRDCRPGPGTAARTHRRRGVSLTEWRRVCYPLPLCPSYRLSFRSGESTPLYLHSSLGKSSPLIMAGRKEKKRKEKKRKEKKRKEKKRKEKKRKEKKRKEKKRKEKKRIEGRRLGMMPS